MINEATFTKLVLVPLCRLPGVRVWRQNVGKLTVRDPVTGAVRAFQAGPPKGAADISGGVAPEGLRLEVEVKMPRGTRTPEQLRWAEFCERMGFVYTLVTYDTSLDDGGNVTRAVERVTHAIEQRRGRS